MQDLLTNVLIALGVSSTAPAPSDFQLFGSTSAFHIDVDMNSIYGRPEGIDWVFKSKLRFRLIEPVKIAGKAKPGSYYIDETTTNCSSKKLFLDRVTLHSADGEILAKGVKIGELPKSDDPNDFVTTYVNAICAGAPKAGTFLEV